MRICAMLSFLLLNGCALAVWVDDANNPLPEKTLIAAKEACDYDRQDSRVRSAIGTAVAISRYESYLDKSGSKEWFDKSRDIRKSLFDCMASKGAIARK